MYSPANISKFIFLCGANKRENIISERRNALIEFSKLHLSDTEFFWLRMDLKDFFPSIHYNDLIPIVENWFNSSVIAWELNDDARELIRLSCFYKNDFLPIGYPSSPIISNIVMYDFDTTVNLKIAEGRFGNISYTRYADDLVFSTEIKGSCDEVKTEIITIINSSKNPKLETNYAKTKLGSSTGGSASVTGLKVCQNGHITIHRKHKDHIRLLLSLYKKNKLKREEYEALVGHLAYCHYVAPAFYSSLNKKYFKEISNLKKESLH